MSDKRPKIEEYVESEQRFAGRTACKPGIWTLLHERRKQLDELTCKEDGKSVRSPTDANDLMESESSYMGSQAQTRWSEIKELVPNSAPQSSSTPLTTTMAGQTFLPATMDGYRQRQIYSANVGSEDVTHRDRQAPSPPMSEYSQQPSLIGRLESPVEAIGIYDPPGSVPASHSDQAHFMYIWERGHEHAHEVYHEARKGHGSDPDVTYGSGYGYIHPFNTTRS